MIEGGQGLGHLLSIFLHRSGVGYRDLSDDVTGWRLGLLRVNGPTRNANQDANEYCQRQFVVCLHRLILLDFVK
jgi:hypothetical protein